MSGARWLPALTSPCSCERPATHCCLSAAVCSLTAPSGAADIAASCCGGCPPTHDSSLSTAMQQRRSRRPRSTTRDSYSQQRTSANWRVCSRVWVLGALMASCSTLASHRRSLTMQRVASASCATARLTCAWTKPAASPRLNGSQRPRLMNWRG